MGFGRCLMVVLVTWKNNKDTIKSEPILQTLNESVVRSGRISKLYEIEWLLPARHYYENVSMENSIENNFPHYKSMGIFQNAKGQQLSQSVIDHAEIRTHCLRASA